MKQSFHQEIRGYLLPTLQILLSMKLLVSHRAGRPKEKIRAAQVGLYQSYWRGRGIDFDQVRPYQYGDDVRHIHWRAMARSGHVYTKLFSEERERTVFIVVDYRASMQFGTKKTFKSVVAAILASKFAWEALLRKDRVGAYIFSENQQLVLRPQGGEAGVLALVKALTDARFANPERESLTQIGLASALSHLRPLIRPGSLILILSDFMDCHDDDVARHLSRLAMHNQIVNLRIEDPLEKSLPKAGLYRFSDQDHHIIQLGLSERSKNYGFWHQKVSDELLKLKKKYAIPFDSISTQDAWDEF